MDLSHYGKLVISYICFKSSVKSCLGIAFVPLKTIKLHNLSTGELSGQVCLIKR